MCGTETKLFCDKCFSAHYYSNKCRTKNAKIQDVLRPKPENRTTSEAFRFPGGYVIRGIYFDPGQKAEASAVSLDASFFLNDDNDAFQPEEAWI